MITLTPRHNKLYQFLASYIDENGIAPSHKEMGEALGFAPKGVVDLLLKELEGRGRIRLVPNRKRVIEIINCDPVDDMGSAQ